jgi:hypothetical protein
MVKDFNYSNLQESWQKYNLHTITKFTMQMNQTDFLCEFLLTYQIST